MVYSACRVEQAMRSSALASVASSSGTASRRADSPASGMSWTACSHASSGVVLLVFDMSVFSGFCGCRRRGMWPSELAGQDLRRRHRVKRGRASAHIFRQLVRIEASAGVEIGHLGRERLAQGYIVGAGHACKIGLVAVEEGGGGALDLLGHPEVAKGQLSHGIVHVLDEGFRQGHRQGPAGL